MDGADTNYEGGFLPSYDRTSLPATDIVEGMRQGAWQLFADGKHQEARDLLKRAIALAPHDAQTYHLLGNIILQSGEPSTAIDILQNAKCLAPLDQDIALTLALARSRCVNSNEQTKILQQFINSTWDLDLKQYAQVHLSYCQNDFHSVVELVSIIRDRFPTDTALDSMLGISFYYLGRYPEAREALQRTLAIFPENPSDLRILGNVELRLGNHDAAAAAYEKALVYAPSNIYLYRQLFRMTLRRGRLGAAWRYLVQAIQNRAH